MSWYGMCYVNWDLCALTISLPLVVEAESALHQMGVLAVISTPTGLTGSDT